MEAQGAETTLAAIVFGRVQGVGFRYFVATRAAKLDLAGTVRNLPNGSVEVKARGERAALEELLRRLGEGPILSRVTGVETEWGAHVPPGPGFQVIH
jgi:acylphosphatase